MDPLGLISPFDTQLAMLAPPIQAVEISLASKSRTLTRHMQLCQQLSHILAWKTSL
jgi:hypothetical protein